MIGENRARFNLKRRASKGFEGKKKPLGGGGGHESQKPGKNEDK